MKLPLWARALDGLAVLMAILTVSVASAGGFRILHDPRGLLAALQREVTDPI